MRQARYAPISTHAPDVPAELCAIADHALARACADRYQTAAEFGAALRGFLGRQAPTYHRSRLARLLRRLFAAEIDTRGAGYDTDFRIAFERSKVRATRLPAEVARAIGVALP